VTGAEGENMESASEGEDEDTPNLRSGLGYETAPTAPVPEEELRAPDYRYRTAEVEVADARRRAQATGTVVDDGLTSTFSTDSDGEESNTARKKKAADHAFSGFTGATSRLYDDFVGLVGEGVKPVACDNSSET
jgi:hypothetical protein